MNPVIVGLCSAVAGAAIWELLLKPAPIDNVVGTTNKTAARNAVNMLMDRGIQAKSQQVYADTYAVLVKAGDLQTAFGIVSPASGIPWN